MWPGGLNNVDIVAAAAAVNICGLTEGNATLTMSPNPWPNDGEQTYTLSAEAMCCLLLLLILLASPGICETWRIAQHQYPWFWKAAFMPQQMSVPWPWHEFYLYSLCYIINKRLWLSCFVSSWVERKIRPWTSNHLTHRLFMPRLKSLCVGDAVGGAQAQGLALHCATTFYRDFLCLWHPSASSPWQRVHSFTVARAGILNKWRSEESPRPSKDSGTHGMLVFLPALNSSLQYPVVLIIKNFR